MLCGYRTNTVLLFFCMIIVCSSGNGSSELVKRCIINTLNFIVAQLFFWYGMKVKYLSNANKFLYHNITSHKHVVVCYDYPKPHLLQYH